MVRSDWTEVEIGFFLLLLFFHSFNSKKKQNLTNVILSGCCASNHWIKTLLNCNCALRKNYIFQKAAMETQMFSESLAIKQQNKYS